MKLRLPHRLQAALVAALASVSFTTLSSGTLSAAFFFGSQSFAEEAADNTGATIDIGDTNLDAQAAIDEEEGKGEAKEPGSAPTGHVGSNGVIGSSDDADRAVATEVTAEATIDTENVGTAGQANYTGTSADLPSNDLGFTANPYASGSDTSNGSVVDSPVTSFTQAPQIAPTGGDSAAGTGSGSNSASPVSVFGNIGSGSFGGGISLRSVSSPAPVILGAAGRNLTQITTVAGDTTYNGYVFNMLLDNTKAFAQRNFYQSTYDKETGTWTNIDPKYTSSNATITTPYGDGGFWTMYSSTSSPKNVTALPYYGTTLRLTGSTSSTAEGYRKLQTDFTDFTIGGLIADDGWGSTQYNVPAYWFFRGGSMDIDGYNAVNMDINSYVRFSYGESVNMKKGGTWNIHSGKTLEFDNNSSNTATTFKFYENQALTVQGGGKLTLGRSSNGTYNVEMQTGSSLLITGNSTVEIGAAAGAITVNGTITVDTGSTLNINNNKVVTIADGASIIRKGTVSGNGKIAGAGTYELDGVTSLGVTLDDTWTGTVRISNNSDFQNIDIDNFGHAGSAVELNGVTGYFKSAQGAGVTFNSKLVIGTGGYTWKSNGYSNSTYELKGGIGGSGTFTYQWKQQTFKVTGDVADWNGSFVMDTTNDATFKFSDQATVVNAKFQRPKGTLNMEVGDGTNNFSTTFNNTVEASALTIKDRASATFANTVSAASVSVAAGGSLVLGNSLTTTGNLSVASGATLKFAGEEMLTVGGDLTLAGTLDVSRINYSEGATVTLGSYSGTADITGASLSGLGGHQATLSAANNALTLTFNDTPVPPPTPVYGDSLGKVMYVGDSITHGIQTGSHRWALHKILVDGGISYTESGYTKGNATSFGAGYVQPGTPYGSVAFENIHSADAGGDAFEITGTGGKRSGHYGYTTIYNWVGYDLPGTDKNEATTKLNGQTYDGPVNSDVDTFIMLIGTNDLLSAWQDNVDAIAGAASDKLVTDIGLIADAMFASSAQDSKLVVYSIPCWTDHANNNEDAVHQAVITANGKIQTWANQYNQTLGATRVQYVDINAGLIDVASDTSFKGCRDLYRNPATDGLHPNAQGDLIIAGNVAKAMGYAGRSVGLTRSSSGEGWKSAPVSSITVEVGTPQTFAQNEFTTALGYTVDFQAVYGDGSDHGWSDKSNALTITIGDGSRTGSLSVSEAYIMWNNKVLYSQDNHTASENLRIAYVNQSINADDNVTAGYYVWLGDMLIGEGLAATSTGSGLLNGIQLTTTGASATVGNLSWADTAYAPITNRYINTEDAFRLIQVNPNPNHDNLVSQSLEIDFTSATENDNRFGTNGQSGTGALLLTRTGTDTNDWFGPVGAAHEGNVSMFYDSLSSTRNIFGVIGGSVTNGNVSIVLDNGSAIEDSPYDGSGNCSIIGTYDQSIGGDFRVEINHATLAGGIIMGVGHGTGKTIANTLLYINGGASIGGDVFGGNYGGKQSGTNTITGNTNIYITGGTVNGSVYGGNKDKGAIDGNTTITITGGIITGDVSGGGTGGSITGSTNVTIEGNLPSIGGNISAQNVTLKDVALNTSSFTDGFDYYRGTITGTSSITLNNYTVADMDAKLVTQSLVATGGTHTTIHNLKLTACDITVDDDSSLTLADSLVLGDTATYTGDLALADGLVIDMSAAGGGGAYSDGENGFREGGNITVMQRGDSGALTVDTTKLTGAGTLVGGTFNYNETTGALTAAVSGEPGTYFVNTGTVVYGGSKSAKDITTATKVQMQPTVGATLELAQNLTTDCTAGIVVTSQAVNAVVRIDYQDADSNRIVLNQSQLHADGVVKLAGDGTFALTSNATALPVNVQLADDWTGAVRVSSSSKVTNLDLGVLANSDSWVEFNGFSGYTKNWAGTNSQNIMLTDNGGTTVAWFADGAIASSGNYTMSFSGKWAGSGTFKTATAGKNVLGYAFSGDISGWTGEFQVAGGTPTITFTGNADEINAAIVGQSTKLKVATNATFSKDVTGITNGLELTAGHHATFKGTTDISGDSTIGGTVYNAGAMTLAGTVTVNGANLAAFDLYEDSEAPYEYSGTGTYQGSGFLTSDAAKYYIVKSTGNGTLNDTSTISGEGYTKVQGVTDALVVSGASASDIYYVNDNLSYGDRMGDAAKIRIADDKALTLENDSATNLGSALQKAVGAGSVVVSAATTMTNGTTTQATGELVVASGTLKLSSAKASPTTISSFSGVTMAGGTIETASSMRTVNNLHATQDSTIKFTDFQDNYAANTTTFAGETEIDSSKTLTVYTEYKSSIQVDKLAGSGTLKFTSSNRNDNGANVSIANTNGFSGSVNLTSQGNKVAVTADISGANIASLSLTGNSSFNASGTGNGSIATLSGSGDLMKDGYGSLTISTASNYTGDVTLNAGTLDLSNAMSAGSLTMTGGTLVMDDQNWFTASSGNITLSGGTLDLTSFDLSSGAASYTLATATNGTVTSSGVTLLLDKRYDPTQYTLTGQGNNLVLTFAPADDTLIWDDNTGDHSWSGSNNWHTQNATESHIAFTDDSDVRFTGTPGSPSPTLTTDVRAGKMTIDQDVALTVNGGSNRLAVDSIDGANANLTLNGGTVSVTNDSAVGSLNGSAALEIGQNATLTVGGKSASSYTGVLSGSGDLTHNGGGTMILSGNSSGYTGDILVTGTDSVLKLGGTNGWGASNTAEGSTRTITAANGGVLDVNKQADPIQAYKVSLADGGTLRNTGGHISNGSAQLANLEVVGDNATAYIDAPYRFGLLGSGYAATTLALNGNTLVKQGNDVFMLVNTTVTNGDGKIGTIRVDAGTLDIGSANNGKSNSVSAATTVFQLNGGTLNFTKNNANLTARGLSTGSNLGTIQGTGGTLTLSPDAGETYTFAGTVKGTRNISKEGEGSQLFTGDLHEVSGGAVSVTAGSLSLANSNATKGNLGSATVTGGALALDSMNVNGAVSVSGSGTLDLLSSTTVGSFSMTGGTLVMDGQNRLTASTGNISLTGGTLDLTGMLLEDSQTSYTLATAAAGEVSCSNVEFTLGTGYDPSLYTLKVLGNNLVLTLGQRLIWDANSDNKWDVGTSPNWHTSAEPTHGSSRFAANDSVIFESGTWAPVLQQDITAGNVAVQSGASVTVDGNSHSLSARAISIAANGSLTTTGALDANTITVGGTLTTAGSASYTLDAVLSGAGSYVKDGTGTVTLSADNSGFTGVFTINEGTVRVGNNKALGTNNAIRLSGGTLDVNGSEGTNTSHTVEFAGGTLTNSGAGKGFNKRQFVNSATITADSEINAANEMGFTASNYDAITVTFSEGTTLNKTGSATFWVSNATVSGNGAFKVSEGKLQFQQNGTYASNFEMAGGEVAGAITMAGAVTVDTTADSKFSATINTNGNALTFDGAAGLAETGVISGNGSLTKTGAGTLTLSGNNTYSGSTTVNGGTLLVSGAASLTTTSGVIVNSGGTLQFDAALGANASSSSIAVAGSSDSLPGGTLTFGGVDDNALNVTGALTLGSGSVLNVREALADFAAERGEHYTVTLAQTTSGITGELGDVLVVGQGGFAYALDRDEADPNKLVVTFVDNRTDLVWNGRDDKVWAGETTETDEHTNWHTANNVYKSRGFHDYDSVSFTSNATATLGADVVSGDLSIVGLSRTVTVKAADHDFTVDGAISGHTASLTVSNAEGTKNSRVEVAGAVDLQNMTLTKADTTLKGHVQVTGTLSAADGSLTLEQSVQAGTLAVRAVAAEIKGEAIIDTMNATGSTVTLDSASTVKGITLAGSTLTNNGAMDMKRGTISVSGTSTINGSGSMKTGGIAMAPKTSLTLNGGQDVNILSSAGISGGGELHLGNATLRAEASAWSIDASITSVELADSVSGTTFRSSGYTLTVDAKLSGNGMLVKEGAGTLRLNGANTYMGDTLVNAGTLVIGGAGSLTSAVTVANGARLVLADDLAASATLGDVTLNSGATLRLSGENELSFTGTLNFGSGSTLDLSNINIVEGRTEPYVLASANSFAGDLNQVTLTMGHGIHPAEGTTPSLTIQDGKLLLSYTANVPRGLIWDGGEATWNTKDVQHWHAEGSSETGTTAFKKYDNVTFENPTSDVGPSVANVSGEVWATGMTVEAGTDASNLNTVTINTATAQDSLRVDFLNAEENTAIVKTGAGSAAIGIANPAHSADLTVKGGSLEVMYVDLEGKGMTVTNDLERDGGAMNLIVGREGVATNLTFDVGTALTDLQSITVNQASTLNIKGSLTESTNVDNVDFNLMESATMNLDSNATASLKTTHWRFNGSGYANLLGTVNWYQTNGAWHEINHTAHVYVERVVFASENTTIRLDDGASLEIGELVFSDNNQTERFFHAFANIKEGERQQIKVGTVNVQGTVVKSIGAIQSNAFSQLWEYQQSGDFDIQTLKGSGTLALLNYSPSNRGGQDTPEVFYIGGGNNSTFSGVLRLDDTNNGTASGRKDTVLILRDETVAQSALIEIYDNANYADFGIGIAADNVKVQGIYDASGKELKSSNKAVVFSGSIAREKDSTYQSDDIVRTLEITGKSTDTAETVYTTGAGVDKNLNIVKKGAGTQVFSGDSSKFNASIEVQEGVLEFSNTASLHIEDLTLGKDKVQQPALMKSAPLKALGSVAANVDTLAVRTDAAGKNVGMAEVNGTLKAKSGAALDSNLTLASGSTLDVRDTLTTQQGEYAGQTDYVGGLDMLGNSLTLHSGTYLSDADRSALLSMQWGERYELAYNVDSLTLGDYTTEASFGYKQGDEHNIEASQYFQNLQEDDYYLCYSGANGVGPNGTNVGVFYIFKAPEPTTSTLSLLALAALAARRRRK